MDNSANTLLKDPAVLPEKGREVVVFFIDKEMMSPIVYCQDCKEWHSKKGNLKEEMIHQWAYLDEYYQSLSMPEVSAERLEKLRAKKPITIFDAIFQAVEELSKEPKEKPIYH